ncbi:MAG: hypothetical protein IPH62_19955 [Ignavibacteriae bacterium]|nr:hypothetical protein [Ignavibacteriota bacterium]
MLLEMLEESRLLYYLGRTYNGGIKTGKTAYSAAKHFVNFSKSAAHEINSAYNYLTPIERIERRIQKVESKLYAAKIAKHNENITKYQSKLNLLLSKQKDIQKDLIRHKESYIAKTKLLQLKLDELNKKNQLGDGLPSPDPQVDKLTKELNSRKRFMNNMGLKI